MTTHMIRIEVDLDVEETSGRMDDNEAFRFITALDEARHDWSFTLRLCDHFDKLRVEHAAEEAEDSARLRGLA